MFRQIRCEIYNRSMNLFSCRRKITISYRVMRKILLLSILIWSVTATGAFSQKPFLRLGWQVIGMEKGTISLSKESYVTDVYIHMKLYNPDENDTKVWVKRYGQTIKFIKNGKEITTKGTILTLYDTNCKQKRLATKEIIYYGHNDIILKSIHFNDYETDWNFVVPDSMGEMILEAACKLL